MRAFLEQIKPVVTVNFEIEDGDKSKLLAFFGTFGLSTLRTKTQSIWPFNELLLYKVRISD